MDVREQAGVWRRNRRVIEDWINDYGKGRSRDDVMSERRAHWVHDTDAESVGTYHGFDVSVIEHNGALRYTVVTPWGTNEGLCDSNERDDDMARARIDEIVRLMAEISDDEPKVEKKVTTMAPIAPRPVRPTPRATEEEPKPLPRRGRGRPKGSKDTKPRKRRSTSARVDDSGPISGRNRTSGGKSPARRRKQATDPRLLTVMMGTVDGAAILPTNGTVWVPDGGSWAPMSLWDGHGLEYVASGDRFVPIPEDGIVSRDGTVPKVVIESRIRVA